MNSRRIKEAIVRHFMPLMSVAALFLSTVAAYADLCKADFDGDGAIGASDLAALLGAWGYEIEDSPGKGGTGDAEVDREHIDVVHLTFTSLSELANRLWEVISDNDAQGVESVAVPADEIRRRIVR